ncbi:MAG: alpha/beta hydrolase [Acidimicrobiales bacterium]
MTTVSGLEFTSRVVDVDGPVHYVDYGGPGDGPLLVAVHGLGGSHLNWAAVAPHLVGRCRLLAVDLLGHGRTPAAGRRPDVDGHVALLDGFLRQVADRPVVVCGNSLGGLVAALCAAGSPDRVAGLVLIDPALPTSRPGMVHPRVATNFVLCAVPGLGERYLAVRRARTTAEQSVRRVLGVICVDPRRVPADVVDDHVALTDDVDRALADQAYLTSARSLSWTLARPGATVARLEGIDRPVLHLHGDRDVLVTVGSARRMAAGRTRWDLQVARDIGHAPMLEAPVWTALRIGEWLDGRGTEARDRSSRPTEPTPTVS